jgi:cyclic pyranopterin monophosphate synthase
MSMHMMDVSRKDETQRGATAECVVRMKPATLRLIRTGKIPKGDVAAVSQTAGILAAKQTPALLPLCHPLLPGSIDVAIDTASADDTVTIRATVTGIGRTGFEMEAMVAASVAALNLYDMCKSVDRAMTIERTRLLHKSGGKSGTYVAGDQRRLVPAGTVVAVCLGQDKGPKSPVSEVVLEQGVGLVGDSHAGSERQVSLLAVETVDKLLAALQQVNPRMMETQGVRIDPGDSAENLLTQGLELVSLPLGTKLRIGADAIVELTQIGKQFHKPGFFLLPLEGVFGKVQRSGTVKPGDPISVVD